MTDSFKSFSTASSLNLKATVSHLFLLLVLWRSAKAAVSWYPKWWLQIATNQSLTASDCLVRDYIYYHKSKFFYLFFFCPTLLFLVRQEGWWRLFSWSGERQDQTLEGSPLGINSRLYPFLRHICPDKCFLLSRKRFSGAWSLQRWEWDAPKSYERLLFTRRKSRKWWKILPGLIELCWWAFPLRSREAHLQRKQVVFLQTLLSVFFPCPKQQNIWFCILFTCRVRNSCRISNTRADKNSSHQHFWLSQIARKKLYKMKKAAVNGGIERCAACRSMAMHWICEWI